MFLQISDILTGLFFDFSLFSCFFFSSLPWSVSRSSGFVFGISSLVFWPLSWSSLPDQTCFLPSPPPLPTPLHRLLGYALLFLPSFLSPFILSSSTPPSSPVIPHFSWTPSMRYSVYRHRYGRLSLLTVSTLIPSWSIPVSSVRCSFLNQQVGSLLLCGLHLLNVQYRLLINVFGLFPLGNKAT